MKIKTTQRFIIYVVLLVAIVFSAMQLGETPSMAVVCCSVGAECTGDQICCNPEAIGALPCQLQPIEKKGYCRASCGPIND